MLRSAYYSNHQEAIPTEAATYKQNELLVVPFSFILSNLLAVVDKRGWHFYQPLASCHPSRFKEEAMYQPSRHLSTFFIAGFQHHDGALVINQMSIGDNIELCPEPDNPYDPESIALYFNGVMVGYVPADQNSLASTLFHFGHRDILECRILQVDKEAAPWKQVRVGMYVTDIRPR